MCSLESPAAPTTKSSEQTCQHEGPVIPQKDSTSRNSRLFCLAVSHSARYWLSNIRYRLNLLVQHQWSSNKSAVGRPWGQSPVSVKLFLMHSFCAVISYEESWEDVAWSSPHKTFVVAIYSRYRLTLLRKGE